MTKVKFRLFASGYTVANSKQVLPGTPAREMQFYATWGLVEHPTEGYILFDTGYAQRHIDLSQKGWAKAYLKALPVFLKPEEEAHTQLKARGIAPEQIRHIIISHFHADHLGGLRDFPKATFHASESAWASVKGRRGFAAVRKAFIPGLLPDDIEARLQLFSMEQTQGQDPHLGGLFDLFGDRSIQLCALEGHARGQVGALLNTEGQTTFLVADAAWVREHLESEILPSSVVRLIFDCWSAYQATLLRLRTYRRINPNTLMIPCHCYETWKEISAKQGE
ncbi:MAG TPA: MBL fold metallo-hydrolase [Cytophagales bacterium]|nr:MBL fold metallo-hydrolase [Cytophagales bacterium]HAA20847.1 MBL fold metallo-hydrolase [Cytophagales bacterium]HAP59134.1 MBL fold metallo-hydrolase [Cytophagales bacterium]